MSLFHSLYLAVDGYFIYFFRLLNPPIFGYMIGCFVLAFHCVIVGRLTMMLGRHVNNHVFRKENREMIKYHNLSLHALFSKNKEAYKAVNKEANEAFGKVMFSNIALSASSLWPAPAALAWMGTRFADVKFLLPVSLPFIGDSVGYAFTFVPMFVLAFIVFKKVKTFFPAYDNLERTIMDDGAKAEKVLSVRDFVRSGDGA